MMAIGKARIFVLTVLLALGAPLLHAANADLDKVLQQMNAAAAKFQNAQADLEWLTYQSVVQEKDIQTGTIAFERKGGQTLMAAHIRQVNGKPAPKDVVFRDNALQYYQPQIKQLTIFSAGANRDQFESLLTLGFGGSGTDLQNNWNISYLGTEQISGVQVAKLQLFPKQENVKRNIKSVIIWVDPARAISLKQQFFDPSGDYRTMTYTNIRYNQKIDSNLFKIKTASGTQTVRK